jgi:hypothetical protein
MWLFIKLPIDTPYEKSKIFKLAIEEYLKARPREWLSMIAFRARAIVPEQNYIEFIIIVQHRER